MTDQTNNQANKKIFVGNLTWRTTSDDLKTHFEQFGEVIDANVVCETYPGRSKGYGFVTFRDNESAVRALENLNPIIDGRTTNCNWVTPGGAKKNINLPNQNVPGSSNQVRPPHQYQGQQVSPYCPPPIPFWDPFTQQHPYMYHNPCYYNPYPIPTYMHNWHQANIPHPVSFAPQRSSVRLHEIINETDQEAVPQRSMVRTERVSETTDQELIADVAHHDNEEAVTKPDVDQQTVENMCEQKHDTKQDDQQTVENMCEQKHDTKQDEDVTIELDNGIEVAHQDERVIEDVVEETP